MLENIFDILEKIDDKESKLRIILLFIEEIGGNMTHIRNVGMSWGAGGEESRASVAYDKYKKVSNRLQEMAVNICKDEIKINSRKKTQSIAIKEDKDLFNLAEVAL